VAAVRDSISQQAGSLHDKRNNIGNVRECEQSEMT